CHAGDSRAYLLREKRLQQVTKDDPYVQSLVDEGEINPENDTSHPQKASMLMAYNGCDVELTMCLLDAKTGDRILLCSYGLSDPVTAYTIESALVAGSLEEVANRLVELALRSGGPDNVTIVLADVVEASEEEVAELDALAAQSTNADTTEFA